MDKTLLTLAGVVISLLLAIIGYFLNKHVTATETLTEAVNSLNITVKLLENSQANLISVSCSEHKIIDTRLERLSKKLIEHSEAITVLQERVSSPRKRGQRTNP